MSKSWGSYVLQHPRLPCPSLSPRVRSNSCSSSRSCYLTISSSAALFSFCLQSFPASGSFPMSWLFASGGQSTGASASSSVLPMHIQGWFPIGLVWSPCSPRDSFSSATNQKHQFFGAQHYLPSLQAYWKNHSCDYTFVIKVMSLLFNVLSRFVIAFLPKSKSLWISWLRLLSTAILEPKKSSLSLILLFPYCLPWSDGTWMP